MTQLAYPFNLQNQTPEDVAQVMANFAAIQAILNGDLRDDNLSPLAAIGLSKLAQGGAGSGMGLVWSGSAWIPASRSGVQRVTALPATPADGDEVYYEIDATNGIYWHFRYRAASGSAHKWEFVGGAPLYAEVDTIETTGSAAFMDIATVGPSITVPRAGEYCLAYGAAMFYSSGGPGLAHMNAAPRMGSIAPSDIDSLRSKASQAETKLDSLSRTRIKTAAAGDVVKLQYRTDGAGVTANFGYRWLSILPIRIS